MSTTDEIGNEASVEGQTDEHGSVAFGDIDEVAERESRLRPSVEQERQAKVDYADEWELEERLFGQTLEAQERMEAIEWEIERTRRRWDRRQDAGREERCRAVVERRTEERGHEFAERAGSVDRWQHPEEADAREQLDPDTLGIVNREATRLSERLEGWSRAAVSRLVAERTVETADVAAAVLATMSELQLDPGCVVPIGRIGEVDHHEVSVEGVVRTLWTPSHPAIAQVGLIEDDSGRTKVTSWRKSAQPRFEEGDRIRIRDAAKSWYDGRCSIALTGRSQVTVIESG